MNRLGWFLCGAILACLLAAVAGAIILREARGFSASEPPGALERWIARRARSAAMPSDARARTNPLQNTPEVLTEARAHWADHCATCHANDGSGDTLLGKHTSPPAEVDRRRTVLRHSKRNPPNRHACLGQQLRPR